MADVNPFQQVYEGLWTLLNANAALVALIPDSGNQINYDGTVSNPEKRAIQPADLPELRIIMSPGGQLWNARTTNGSSYSQRFEIQISTGEKGLTSLFEVEWETLRALADWKSVFGTMTWGGEEFVKYCLVTEIASQSLNNEELNREQPGWSTIWAGEVQMWFTTEALKP